MYSQNERRSSGNSIKKIVGSLCLIAIVSCLEATALQDQRPNDTRNIFVTRPRCGSSVANRQFCSKTCSRVTQLCERDCLSSACDEKTDTHFKKADKMQCVAICFGKSDTHQTRFLRQHTARSKIHTEVTDFEDTTTLQDRAVWKQEMADLEIDSDTLQTLCRTNAFRDAKVCRDAETLEISQQKAVVTQHKSEKKENGVVKRLLQVRGSPSDRSKRSTPILARFARSAKSRVRVCQASTTLETLKEALHARSNTTVTLLSKEKAALWRYTKNFTTKQYEQQFQVAKCAFQYPFNSNMINVSRHQSPECKPVKSKHLADIVINSTRSDIRLFQKNLRCSEVAKDILVCRDWIVLESSCALFATKTETGRQQ